MRASGRDRMDVAAAAARDNAAWCGIVCRLHGIEGVFGGDAWTSPVRTPEHYPDAVTLRRSVDAASLLSRIDPSRGCSIKDSFADLDLVPWGFGPLFEAFWIVRPAGAVAPSPGSLTWERVTDGAVLAAWTAARTGDPGAGHGFPPQILERTDVIVLAGMSAERIVAGAILSLGTAVVGISNLFVVDADATEAFAGVAAATALRFPGRDLVGYEAGETLDAAECAGFRRAGRLVVWLRR